MENEDALTEPSPSLNEIGMSVSSLAIGSHRGLWTVRAAVWRRKHALGKDY